MATAAGFRDHHAEVMLLGPGSEEGCVVFLTCVFGSARPDASITGEARDPLLHVPTRRCTTFVGFRQRNASPGRTIYLHKPVLLYLGATKN